MKINKIKEEILSKGFNQEEIKQLLADLSLRQEMSALGTLIAFLSRAIKGSIVYKASKSDLTTSYYACIERLNEVEAIIYDE